MHVWISVSTCLIVCVDLLLGRVCLNKWTLTWVKKERGKSPKPLTPVFLYMLKLLRAHPMVSWSLSCLKWVEPKFDYFEFCAHCLVFIYLFSFSSVKAEITSQQGHSSGLGYTFNSQLTAEENVLGWLRFLLETDNTCSEAALQSEQPLWRFY